MTATSVTPRKVGTGSPVLPWVVREYGEYGEYEGHAFITADPKGLARSVCDGFYDDMAWIVGIHNAVLADGWRARLARRLLGVDSGSRERQPKSRQNGSHGDLKGGR